MSVRPPAPVPQLIPARHEAGDVRHNVLRLSVRGVSGSWRTGIHDPEQYAALAREFAAESPGIDAKLIGRELLVAQVAEQLGWRRDRWIRILRRAAPELAETVAPAGPARDSVDLSRGFATPSMANRSAHPLL